MCESLGPRSTGDVAVTARFCWDPGWTPQVVLVWVCPVRPSLAPLKD